jgi:PAS domain S-box-containing protein
MPDKQAIRVLVAEDEEPLRRALGDLVAGDPGLELAAVAADAEEAVALAAEHAPDVAIVDVRMPGGGKAATLGIRERSPATAVLALSAYDDWGMVFDMLRAGAVGYLVKGIDVDEILEAVRRASRGQASISAELVGRVLEEVVGEMAERERAQDELRRNEELFRGLLESSPDAIVIADLEGELVLVNACAEELFGYRREELVGRNVDILLPAPLRERHGRQRAAYAAAPHTRPMGTGLDLVACRRDGTEFAVDIALSTVDSPGGRLVIARVRDVTVERAEAEARRKSEERFRALLESAPDAVVIADPGGRIVLVNEQVERQFGYERDELIGTPVETLLPERFRHRHVRHRAEYMRNPVTRPMGAGLELAGRRKDGSEFPVDISLSAIDTPEGKLVTAFVRDATDRTERAALERSLAERQSLLARLVAAGEEERRRVAADIHDDSIQAIAAAGIRIQLLRRKLADEEHIALVREVEKSIELSIARLRHLLFDLRPPALDHEGLSPALLMYIAETEHQSETRFLLDDRLRSQPPHETRTILYRIAQEALTNVRKHANAANATVTLEEREGGYVVQIRDDGLGFDPAAPDAGAAPGHLGLVAMRERATLAGGRLSIESTPGEGTTVEVWVPAFEAEQAAGEDLPLANDG